MHNKLRGFASGQEFGRAARESVCNRQAAESTSCNCYCPASRQLVPGAAGPNEPPSQAPDARGQPPGRRPPPSGHTYKSRSSHWQSARDNLAAGGGPGGRRKTKRRRRRPQTFVNKKKWWIRAREGADDAAAVSPGGVRTALAWRLIDWQHGLGPNYLARALLSLANRRRARMSDGRRPPVVGKRQGSCQWCGRAWATFVFIMRRRRRRRWLAHTRGRAAKAGARRTAGCPDNKGHADQVRRVVCTKWLIKLINQGPLLSNETCVYLSAGQFLSRAGPQVARRSARQANLLIAVGPIRRRPPVSSGAAGRPAFKDKDQQVGQIGSHFVPRPAPLVGHFILERSGGAGAFVCILTLDVKIAQSGRRR